MRLHLIALMLSMPCWLTGCMSLHQPLGLPDSSVLSYDGARVLPPNCATLSAPSTLLDAGFQRASVAFGCATYTNLAAMLARPADLSAPRPLTAPNAVTGAAAAQRYFDGAVTPLSKAPLQ